MPKYDMPHMGGSTISARLTARLVGELRNGDFAECLRLPSELELAERYNVSRSVIRDVLSDLEREGFVERGRGIGTIVHRDVVNMTNRLDVKFEYNELVSGRGCQPTADSIRVYEKAAGEDIADRLGLDVGESLITIEKRILASGRPVIFSVDHMPLSLFSAVDYLELDWAAPVFDLLETHCGIIVDSDVAQISATMGDERVRSLLGAEEGEALLLVDEIGYYKLSRPIIQTYGYYSNFFDFTILRKKM